MEELKNTDKKGVSTKRKIGKTTYEVVILFNENATEAIHDKLTRIMPPASYSGPPVKNQKGIKKSLGQGSRNEALFIHAARGYLSR